MSAQTISLRLPEEEVAILSMLSERERRTKTQIIRDALQPIFQKVLEEPERIELSMQNFRYCLMKSRNHLAKRFMNVAVISWNTNDGNNFGIFY